MRDFLFFDKMLTPKLITVLYWLLMLSVLVSGVGAMFAGMGFSFGGFLRGVFMIIVGLLGVRIFCELMIVLFKMNEALQDIRNK
jgi:hypothetical protein